jgi:predicted nucleic acid-binding Zn ribbon protein
MPRKKKKCKVCAKPFEPKRPLQQVCSVGCSYELVMQLKAKQQAKNNAILEEARETTSDLRHKLQTEINKLIRAIDYGQPCISCGVLKQHMEACHYYHKSKNSASECTFHLWNLHSGCKFCNRFQNGNLIKYGINIEKVYGEEIYNLLHDLPTMYRGLNWSKDELKEFIRVAKLINKSMPKQEVYSTEKRIELRAKFNNQLNIYTI